jgi:hypothetical protein
MKGRKSYQKKRWKNERRLVYNLLRKMGYSISTARRLRDWTANHILQYINANGIKNETRTTRKAK